jgi:hypothetical protein
MHYAQQRRQHLELSVWILKYPSRWAVAAVGLLHLMVRSRIYFDAQNFYA